MSAKRIFFAIALLAVGRLWPALAFADAPSAVVDGAQTGADGAQAGAEAPLIEDVQVTHDELSADPVGARSEGDGGDAVEVNSAPADGSETGTTEPQALVVSRDAAPNGQGGMTGWAERDGKRYWYDDGVMARDKQVFDPGTRQWYWFDADGSMAVSKDVFIPVSNTDRSSGKWVRYDANGHMIKGEDLRYGGWYYFDPVTGEMAKGVRLIPSDGGKWVYYDQVTGRMAHGEARISYDEEHDGWYFFDPVSGAMAHGFAFIPSAGKWCLYDFVTGKMKYGEQVVNGSWYYLDTVTGAVAYGFKYFDAAQKWVYYHPVSGIMAHGEANVGDGWCYLDDVTGAVQYGWKVIPSQGNKQVYYQWPTGRMAHGNQTIYGRRYKFDTVTGGLVWGESDAVPSANISSSMRSSLSIGSLANAGVRSVRVLGDSIMAGYGAPGAGGATSNQLFNYQGTTYFEPAYGIDCAANSLRAVLSGRGISMLNASVPGSGSMNLFSRADKATMGNEDAAIVVLGTNDRGAFDSSETIDDFIRYSESYISSLTERYGRNVIVLSGIPV